MILTVTNRTLGSVVLNSELGSVGPRKTVHLDLTIDEIERSRVDLVRLASSGIITFSTTKTSNATDDAAEGATVAYADSSGGGGGGVPTSREVIAGNGLDGGGALSSDVTIEVQAADASISVTGAGLSVGVIDNTQHGSRSGGSLHAAVVAAGASGFMTGADKTKLDGLPASAVPTTLQVNTTAPLSGGGALSGNLTLTISAATTGAAGSMSAADKTKLDGVETLADVTDAANVAAAGAVMTPGGVADGDLIVRSAGAWARLPAGTNGHSLQLVGGTPTWNAQASGGSPQFRGLRGFTTTSYYQRASGSVLQGNANPGFDVMLAVILDVVEGGGFGTREIVSNSYQFIENGYMVGVDDVRPTFNITDGANQRFGVFFGGWARGRQGKSLVFLNVGYNHGASQRFFVVNGVDYLRASQTGYTPGSSLPVRLGFNADGGSASARSLTVVGYAMRTSGELSASQREEAMRTFLTTGNFPTSLFNHRFPMTGLTLGAAPATLVDDIAGINMTLVGSSVTVVDDGYTGQALTASPTSDETVTFNGSFLPLPTQLVASAGPTAISANSVRCNTASVAPTVVTPQFPPSGVEIVVFDLAGNAAANNITINAYAGQLINGSGSTTITTNYGYRRLMFGGTNWTIVGSS